VHVADARRHGERAFSEHRHHAQILGAVLNEDEPLRQLLSERRFSSQEELAEALGRKVIRRTAIDAAQLPQPLPDRSPEGTPIPIFEETPAPQAQEIWPLDVEPVTLPPQDPLPLPPVLWQLRQPFC